MIVGLTKTVSSCCARKGGQPFLRDHRVHKDLAQGDGGPLHIVACYIGVTESQALKMLGFPDAIVIPGRFGLHVADPVQKIQIVLLKNCESPTATRSALTAWLELLQRSPEDRLVAERAVARKRTLRQSQGRTNQRCNPSWLPGANLRARKL